MNKVSNIQQDILKENTIKIDLLVELAKLSVRDLLIEYSQSLSSVEDLQLAFGDIHNFDLLKKAWQAKEFTFLEIEVVNRNQINNANGAFARETNKIYLAHEFLLANQNNLNVIADVLLEEYGHYLDSQLNVNDTSGDEGAIFAALVRGKEFSSNELQQLKEEDDSAVVVLDGEEIAIEQNDPGDTLATALNIGILTGERSFANSVTPEDSTDIYRFSLSEISDVRLFANGTNQSTVYFDLIHDFDGDNQIDSNDDLYFRRLYASNEAEIISTLGAGTYFVRMRRSNDNTNTNYNLSLSATANPSSTTDPGDTLATAMDLGSLGAEQNIKQFLGSVDSTDIYRFSLSEISDVRLFANGTNQSTVYFDLIHDFDGDNQIDSNDDLYFRRLYASNEAEIISTLGAGTYFVRMRRSNDNTNTNYNFSLSATANPSSTTDPGDTLATAMDLGSLGAEQNIKQFLGSVDSTDIYRFNLSETSDVRLFANGTNQSTVYFDLIHDFDGDNQIDSNDDLYFRRLYASNEAEIISTLGAGTYFVRMRRSNDNTNTNYNLSLSATANPNGEPDPRTVDLPDPNEEKDEDNVDIDNEIVNLSPLKVEVIDGEFTYNEETLRFETEGTIQIGLTNGVFPLATLEGTASYKENQDFEASGLLSASIGNLNLPLFEENFKINIGESTTSFLTDTTQNAINNFNIPGTEIEFTAIDFTTEGLALEGNLQLPEVFGNAKIALERENKLLIDENGVNFTGLTAEFPDINFKLFNSDLLELEATELFAEYKHKPISERGLTIQGEVSIPSLFNAKADFSGDNYIRINSNGRLDVVGFLSVEDVHILQQNGARPNWGVKEATLEFETIGGELHEIVSEATVFLPQGLEIGGGLGFRRYNGEVKFDYMSVVANGLNKPIGTTGAFIQGIDGSVDYINNPQKIGFNGGVDLTYGSKISVDLPSWAGGNFGATLATLNINGELTSEHISANGNIHILGNVLYDDSGRPQLDDNGDPIISNSVLSGNGKVDLN